MNMGGVTCPNCGKENPDFLDNCQFCQTALRRESTLNIGENPTKKVTGDLEPILPDWLREARQQGRDSAEEEAKKEATKPKIQAIEPPDLLAGLAFQAASDEDEVPDWLVAINPVEKKAPAPSKPAAEEPTDFFARFNQPTKETSIPAPDDTPAWMAGSVDNTQKDELAGWMPQASGSPDEPFRFDSDISQEPAAAWTEPAKPAEPEDLGWLHDLESSNKPQPAAPQSDMDWMANLDSSSAPAAGSQDDLSWLNNLGGKPVSSFDMPAPAQPESSQEDLSWLNNLGGTPAPSFDEPTPAQPASSDLDWLSNLGGTPASSFDTPASAQPASSQEDLDWLNKLGSTTTPSFEIPTPAQPASSQEDLGWLNNLGGTPASSFDTPAQPASSQEDLDWLNKLGGTTTPSFETPTPAQPTSSQEDLDWLNNLGDTPASSFDTPAQPASSQEDLGWLNNLGDTPAASFDTSTSPQPASSQEDLDWLSNLGNTPAPSFDEPAPAKPASSQEDLDWLSSLGGTTESALFSEPAPAQPASSDLDWLNNLGGTTTPSFNETIPVQPETVDWLKNIDGEHDATPPASMFLLTPRQTAPLSEDARASMPDWLKSATEGASMPPLGATSMDWFASKDKQADDAAPRFDESASQADDQTLSTPASADQNLFPASSDSAPLSNQDIDSLFAVEMPDWLSQAEPATGESSAQRIIPSETGDELAPVNLPSWVQAMRPVESVLGDVSAVSADQTTEQEGPLAGFRGVIPFAPIGSALRPKSISLKLQATEEQLASASLFEQILASETTVRPLKTTPFVVSQRVLRWVLSGLFVIVLGAIVGLGTQQMPVSAALPIAVSNASNVVATMPDQAPVLVVLDYEPALSGEMEAVAGPLLDQMAVLRRPTFSFISTSPNGSALVERLLKNTKINQDASAGGLGYQADIQYFNLGYLPGGSAGVRGFTDQPKTILPSVNVNLFSDFAVVIVITDHAESGLVWIEQLELTKQTDPALANQSLLVLASAQAGPLLQPYVLSSQVDGMISGLSDAARYEYVNNSRPGLARSYWDAFGAGLFMAILAIVLGSLWSLYTGIRARRTEAELG